MDDDITKFLTYLILTALSLVVGYTTGKRMGKLDGYIECKREYQENAMRNSLYKWKETTIKTTDEKKEDENEK